MTRRGSSRTWRTALALACAASALAPAAAVQNAAPFAVEEVTVAQIQQALATRVVTCRGLVEQYRRRIDAYDKRGPAINAVVRVNPNAMADADALDLRFARSGPVGPLHCVPLIVKDNYETIDMPTTAGSLSLEGMTTGKDAFVVRRLRDAGALVIAKSNMAEFAFTQYETVSSILPGYTRNPYDTMRVTAGSSGGTAAAVAANFAAVGIGTDTGASIRGPASHQALVGIRPTMGLTSRAGVVPVFLDSDVTGPMTRTVADAAVMLQVMAGRDPNDVATGAIPEGAATRYVEALDANGLKGARVGVIHQIYDTPTMDEEVSRAFRAALDDLRRAGAQVIDPVAIDGLDEMRRLQSGLGGCNAFKFEINRYLAGLGAAAPMHSLDEIVKSRRFHPSIQLRLETSQAADDVPGETPGCRRRVEFRSQLRRAVLALLDAERLDVLVYPTWSNPPRLIGDLNTPHGDNNQLLSPATGFPALTVPMGYARDGTLPLGLQMIGRVWSEATLIRLAYAFEQATHHRRPPTSVPPLGRF